MGNKIFDIVEVVGALFLIGAAFFVVYQLYEIVGMILLFVYLITLLGAMVLSTEYNKSERDKVIHKSENGDDSELLLLSRVLEEKEGEKWLVIGFQIPLTLIVIVYTYQYITSGVLYIVIYLFLSIAWTKLRVSHSVFQGNTQYHILNDKIYDLEEKHYTLNRDLEYIQSEVKDNIGKESDYDKFKKPL